MPSNLLSAIEAEPQVLERRRETPGRRFGERRRRIKQSVGIEVSPGGVSLAIVQEATEGRKHRLVTDYIAFEQDSRPHKGDWTGPELAQALTLLTEKHRLIGQSVVVGLGGEACVTRSLVGDNDDVAVQVTELIERSNRYLALGLGEKICCYAEKTLNAKRKRAWVTIAHRPFVDAVVHSIGTAGLRISRIEHSLSAVCEVIGSSKLDEAQPVLIVSTGCGAADLTLSHAGQLLLDYRLSVHADAAATACSLDSWADSVRKHIKCLRRFLMTQVPAGTAQLATIYLLGRKTVSPEVAQQLQERCHLDVRGFPISNISSQYECVGEPPDHSEMLAAIWYAGRSLQTEPTLAADLLESVRQKDGIPWLPLAKALWPIAAVALFVLGLALETQLAQKQLAAIEMQVEALHPSRMEAGRLQAEIGQSTETQTQIAKLKEKLHRVSWNEILYRTGRLLPQGTWLESLAVDRESNVTVVGASFTDDAIYEFITRLNKTHLFKHVSLRSTQKIHSSSGPVFRFDITADASVEPANTGESESLAKSSSSSPAPSVPIVRDARGESSAASDATFHGKRKSRTGEGVKAHG